MTIDRALHALTEVSASVLDEYERDEFVDAVNVCLMTEERASWSNRPAAAGVVEVLDEVSQAVCNAQPEDWDGYVETPAETLAHLAYVRSITPRQALGSVTDFAHTMSPERRAALRDALLGVAQAYLDAAAGVVDEPHLRYRYGAWVVAEIADAVRG